jgi:membrane protein HdeD
MKDWLKWTLLGVLSVVFGIYVLGNAFLASVVVTAVVGVLLLVSGGFQIVAGFMSEGAGAKIFGVLLGILVAYVGISFVSNPLEGVLSLTMVLLIMFAISGVIRLVFASRMRETPFFWPMLITGALSLFLAIYLFNQFDNPKIAELIGILMGIELLFNGFGLVILGLSQRSEETA